MGKLTLILGGARSGKSTYAEQLAKREAGAQVLYVATAEAGDEEMQQRIEAHRRARPSIWQTLEATQNVGGALLDHNHVDVVLLDCLTLLVANNMGTVSNPFAGEVAARIEAEIEQIVAALPRLKAHVIIVSNEVGMGLVPTTPLGRAYRERLGKANQRLAQVADSVILMVAGLPMTVKGEQKP